MEFDFTETETIEHDIEIPMSTNKLCPFMHFPQPIFLLKQDLQLIETNQQGKLAINKLWLGLNKNKLNFNSKQNNIYVKKLIEQLYEGSNELMSQRFLLRSIDMIYRPYVLSRESETNDNLLLTIQYDLSNTENKLKSLSQVFSLSSSETNIVKMMIKGMKPKEIAYEAGISLNTVRSHLRTLYAKMQVRNYSEALMQAVRLLA